LNKSNIIPCNQFIITHLVHSEFIHILIIILYITLFHSITVIIDGMLWYHMNLIDFQISVCQLKSVAAGKKCQRR